MFENGTVSACRQSQGGPRWLGSPCCPDLQWNASPIRAACSAVVWVWLRTRDGRVRAGVSVVTLYRSTGPKLDPSQHGFGLLFFSENENKAIGGEPPVLVAGLSERFLSCTRRLPLVRNQWQPHRSDGRRVASCVLQRPTATRRLRTLVTAEGSGTCADHRPRRMSGRAIAFVVPHVPASPVRPLRSTACRLGSAARPTGPCFAGSWTRVRSWW